MHFERFSELIVCVLPPKMVYFFVLRIYMLYRFWESVQELKSLPQKDVLQRVNEIWVEYLGSDASCPINVDSHSHEITKKNMTQPDRWSFDTAAVSCKNIILNIIVSTPTCTNLVTSAFN